MEGRQRLGAILVVAGVGLALVGVAGALGFVGGPSTATASPAPTATGPAATSGASATVPAPSVAAPTVAPPTTAPTQDTLALVTAFFADLEAAFHDGSQETLADRVGAAVIDRYGAGACAAELATKAAVPEQRFVILAVHDPAPWDYVTDERTTTIPDATTVDARVTGLDGTGAITTTERQLHVQIVDGTVRWFTDCGTPLL